MTFTEAAIEVLRREGKPLHFRKITEIAVRENLLDHVGKIPEEVMADQVAAHCRLPRLERKLLAVQAATFALVEWGLDEDPQGLENLVEPPPVDDVPYRGRERHPAPMRAGERARGDRAERGEKGRRRDEGEERRSRRFPPPAEVAYEILAGAAQPLSLTAIAAQGAERLLMPDAFVRDTDALGAALQEDNRRREQAGRRPLFQVDDDLVTLVAQPEPGERAAVVSAPRSFSPADLRRAGLAAVRRRLRECDAPTVEHLVVKLLEQLAFREVKVAKRGREHVIFTGRKRMGLVDVRHCVRVVRTGADAARRDVVDTRRDLGHYGAQIGVVVTAGEAGREARAEAGAAGQLPVLLLAGEALAEAFADAQLGCVPVLVPDVDEPFFAAAAEAAGREEEARRARREERDRREGERGGGERPDRPDRPERAERRERRDERRPEREAGDEAATGGAQVAPPAEPVEAEVTEGAPTPAAGAPPEAPLELVAQPPAPRDEDEEGDEGDDAEGEGAGEGAAQAATGPNGEPRPPGEGGRRRRRRRRRRGGRGRGERREGAPAAGEGGGAPPEGGDAGASAAPPPAPAAPPPPAGGGEPGEA